jgi:hypothetical protein
MSHRVLAFTLIVLSTGTIAAAGDPLQARVTVSFTNAAAADVVKALAAGAGITAKPVRPGRAGRSGGSNNG